LEIVSQPNLIGQATIVGVRRHLGRQIEVDSDVLDLSSQEVKRVRNERANQDQVSRFELLDIIATHEPRSTTEQDDDLVVEDDSLRDLVCTASPVGETKLGLEPPERQRESPHSLGHRGAEALDQGRIEVHGMGPQASVTTIERSGQALGDLDNR
jgi:hypothetical protein